MDSQLERTIARPAILIALVAAAFVAFSGWRYIPFRDGGESYGIICKHESGLPGAATGKLYDRLAPDDAPMTVDGQVYGPGDYVFLGYCGPDGTLIR